MATSGCLTRNNAYLFVFPSTSTEGTALLLPGEDRSASPAGMKSLYLALHERGSANSVAMASPGSGTSGSAASVADRRSCLFLLTASLVGANAGIFTATEAAGAAEAAGACPRPPTSTSNRGTSNSHRSFSERGASARYSQRLICLLVRMPSQTCARSKGRSRRTSTCVANQQCGLSEAAMRSSWTGNTIPHL